MLIDNITDEIQEQAKRAYPDNCMIFDTELTKEEIIRLLLEEFLYWSKHENIDAFGALSNVIAKIQIGNPIRSGKLTAPSTEGRERLCRKE